MAWPGCKAVSADTKRQAIGVYQVCGLPRHCLTCHSRETGLAERPGLTARLYTLQQAVQAVKESSGAAAGAHAESSHCYSNHPTCSLITTQLRTCS